MNLAGQSGDEDDATSGEQLVVARGRAGRVRRRFHSGGAWVGVSGAREAAQSATDNLGAQGRAIFQRERCFFCHALSSPELRLAPRRTDDWHLAHLIDPAAVVAGSSMPSFAALPEADLRALIALVQSNNAAPPFTPGPTESIPQIAADLAAYRAGQRLYADHCAGCHGEFGNGIGRVGHLLRPEPRDFTNTAWMGRRSDEYLYEVIADGLADTAMPGYRDLLTPGERALLLRYLRYFADPAAKQALEHGLAPP